MSAEEFWKDDPQLFASYRISFINKKQKEMEEEDYKSWLRGYYIHDSSSKIMMSFKQFINNILASIAKKPKDNTKIDTYPKKPYLELEREYKQKEKSKNEKYKQFEESLVYYGTLKQQYLDRLQKKKGE